MKRLTLLAVGLLPFVSQVHAADGDNVIGPGANSCGKYIEASSDPDAENLFTSWGLGFITGVANMAPKKLTRPLPDSASVKLYMHNYCQAHPLNLYSTGVTQLVLDLYQK